jgi:peptidoglycan/xylan/chitin deacetylase (PgdA/CDA1 family)
MEAKEAARFRATLRMLRNAFEFVSLAEAVSLLRDAAPPAGRYLAFSFDDGYRDNYEVIAPLLHEFGARACFFVSTGFLGCDDSYRRWFLRCAVRQAATRQPMTWEMVSELVRAGFEIGAHTVDHVNLAALKPAEAEQQVMRSAIELERRLGRPCRWFAWPYGTEAHLPDALLPRLTERFDGIFSAIRSGRSFSYEGRVINRAHFEPAWPALHVRYFAFRATTL